MPRLPAYTATTSRPAFLSLGVTRYQSVQGAVPVAVCNRICRERSQGCHCLLSNMRWRREHAAHCSRKPTGRDVTLRSLYLQQSSHVQTPSHTPTSAGVSNVRQGVNSDPKHGWIQRSIVVTDWNSDDRQSSRLTAAEQRTSGLDFRHKVFQRAINPNPTEHYNHSELTGTHTATHCGFNLRLFTCSRLSCCDHLGRLIHCSEANSVWISLNCPQCK